MGSGSRITSTAGCARPKTAADLAAVLPSTAEVKRRAPVDRRRRHGRAGQEAGTALYVMDEATIRHQLPST